MGSKRAYSRDREPFSDPRKLVGRDPGGLEVADGRENLYRSEDHLRTRHAALLLVEQPANRGCGEIALPLRKLHERKARLGRLPIFTGLSIRFRRFRHIAAQPVNLGQFVESGAGWIPERILMRAGPFAGALSLGQGLGPVTALTEDFGAVDEALATERDDLGLRGDPSIERCGPFARAAEIKQ